MFAIATSSQKSNRKPINYIIIKVYQFVGLLKTFSCNRVLAIAVFTTETTLNKEELLVICVLTISVISIAYSYIVYSCSLSLYLIGIGINNG